MTETNFQPVDAAIVPRFAAIATFMRLPLVTSAAGLDIALVGVPWDGGTTNRAGARHGPREIRTSRASCAGCIMSAASRLSSCARVADLGDAPVNPIDLPDRLKRIEAAIAAIVRPWRRADRGGRRSSDHAADHARDGQGTGRSA